MVSGSVCKPATQNASGEGGIYIYTDIYQWNVRRRYLSSLSTERERERERDERERHERERERVLVLDSNSSMRERRLCGYIHTSMMTS